MPVFLTEQDVRIVLSMPDLIEAMERALVRILIAGSCAAVAQRD